MPLAIAETAPHFVQPMLCSSGSTPTGSKWGFEVKWDGIRAQLRVDRGRAYLRTRPGRDCGHDFADVLRAGAAIDARSVILDGEVVCFDKDGKPDFAAVRRRLV